MTPPEIADLIERLDDQAAQIAAMGDRIDDLASRIYNDRIDDLASRTYNLAAMGDRIDDLASRIYNLDSTVRDVGYRVDDAQRAAERAASSNARGW